MQRGYKKFYIILLLLVSFSCSKIKDEYSTFTIKEGKHRSVYALNYSRDTMFGWNIKFDSSAIYETVDSVNQLDINKLIGWSDCSSSHTENSIRFGWRWLNDSLEIHWFKHEQGEFSFDLIKRVSICEEHYYEMTISTWDYKLSVDGTYVHVPKNCPDEYRRYQLYPYFGGNEPAPHKIQIKIKNQ